MRFLHLRTTNDKPVIVNPSQIITASVRLANESREHVIVLELRDIEQSLEVHPVSPNGPGLSTEETVSKANAMAHQYGPEILLEHLDDYIFNRP